MSAAVPIRRAIDWCLHTEGSTRSSALIRIFLVPVLWCRWAEELAFFRNPSAAEALLSASFYLSTTLMLIGLFSRSATLWAGLTTLTMYFYFGIELGREPWTHHHTYLLAFSTFLCAFTPCGGSYSVDRWMALRRAERAGRTLPPERANLWGLRLISLQLALMYFYTALDKTSAAFLGGERLEIILQRYFMGSDFPQWTGYHELMVLASWGTVGLEYALAVGLLFALTRRWLMIAGLLLHAAFYVLLPVLTFSVTVAVLYLAVLDADRVHEVIDRLGGTAGLPAR